MCVWTLFLHYFSCDSVRHLAFVVFGCLPFFRLFLSFFSSYFLFFFMVAVKCKSHNTITNRKTKRQNRKMEKRDHNLQNTSARAESKAASTSNEKGG